jgi:N-acetylglutamate synthase-like GNAT family acetyltransferase
VFTIRKATRADALAVWEIRTLAIRFQCVAAYTLHQIGLWTSSALTARYEDTVEESVYVTVADDMLIGTGMVDLSTGQIDAIFVHPDYMGRGAARQMMHYLEQQAVRAGLEHIYLNSTLNAAPFYRKCGFKGGMVSVYHSPQGLALDCIPMRKALSHLINLTVK